MTELASRLIQLWRGFCGNEELIAWARQGALTSVDLRAKKSTFEEY
jgi:hypothetical protein